MADQSPGAEVPESPHDQGKPAEDAGGFAPWSNVTGVTDAALVVEPGDALVIMCGLKAEDREALGNQLRGAMPGVRVEVSFLWSGGATLLYRPNRDRAMTDAAPPQCVPDPHRVTGWRCAPDLVGRVHRHRFPEHRTANRLAWDVEKATGAFTPLCGWCLHAAAAIVPCSCWCHESADAQAAESISRAVEHAAGWRPSSTIDPTSAAAKVAAAGGALWETNPVPVPERVDELPPLGDLGHDQAADQ